AFSIGPRILPPIWRPGIRFTRRNVFIQRPCSGTRDESLSHHPTRGTPRIHPHGTSLQHHAVHLLSRLRRHRRRHRGRRIRIDPSHHLLSLPPPRPHRPRPRPQQLHRHRQHPPAITRSEFRIPQSPGILIPG